MLPNSYRPVNYLPVNNSGDPQAEHVREAAELKYGFHRLVQEKLDAPRTLPTGRIDWIKMRTGSPTVLAFLDQLFIEIEKLPPAVRAHEFEAVLMDIEPSLNDAVLEESKRLLAEGHSPNRALRAALGAALVARRKKHFRMAEFEIIPYQARKAAEGIFFATPDPKERARRIKTLIDGLLPEQRPAYDPAQARIRLRELGLSRQQVESAMRAPQLTREHVASGIESDMAAGVAPVDAMARGIERALRAYTLDVLKSNGVSRGVEFCWVVGSAIIAAAVSLIGTVVGIAVPAHQAADARRAATRAEGRQRAAPLSAGEVEQIVGGVLRSGATTWGVPQRQAALDYLRVNRLGRTTFVQPEERTLQAAFDTARAAIVAQEQAARRAQEKKVMIGVGIGAAVLVGGALIIKRARS